MDAVLAGLGEASGPVSADLGSSAFVFVVGGDVADAGVEADVVVLVADAGELGVQHDGVLDVVEVRVVEDEVGEEALDVGLVGGGAGPSEVLPDRDERHELAGVFAGHLRAVVRPGQQHRFPAGEIGAGGIIEHLVDVDKRPSASRARMNSTWVWVIVNSGVTMCSIHLRDTTSMITTT